MISPTTHAEIITLLDQGYTAPMISKALGVPTHTVYNAKRGGGERGGIKPPNAKREDAGTSRYPGREEFIREVEQEYYSQSKRYNILSACVDNVKALMGIQHRLTPFALADKSTILRHVYRTADAEKWEAQFAERKFKHGYQSVRPKLWHDPWRQVGFMDFVVLDGRKADQWVAGWRGGNMDAYFPQTFAVMELLTRHFLHMSISDKAHDAKQVLTLLLHVFLSKQQPWGRPHYGIICDNGGEQVSANNVAAMELFWTRDELEDYRRGSGKIGFHDIVPGAKSPVVISPPRVPSAWGKAPLEAAFYTIQKRMDAFTGLDAYQGGGRNDVPHRDLNRSISKKYLIGNNPVARYLNNALWFFTGTEPSETGLPPYGQIERPEMLKTFALQTGMRPTVANAVAHCLATHHRDDIPEEHFIRILYHSLDRLDNKTVNAIAQVQFQHRNETRQFWCSELTEDWLERKVSVAIVPGEEWRAAIYAGPGEFIGWGTDIPWMYHYKKISVADGREVASEIAKEADARMKTKRQKIKETPHTVPQMEPAQQVHLYDVGNQPQLPDLDENMLSPEMREMLEI